MPPRRKPVTNRPSPKAGAKRQRTPSQLSNPEPTAHICRHNVCNPLMAVYTIAVMDPKKQSTIRSAGNVGVDIYEEVVAQGLAGTHLVLGYHIDGSDKKQHAPYRIQPLQKTAFDNDDVLAIAPSDLEMLANQGGRNRIRSHVKRIQLTGFDHVTKISSFLSNCTSIATIELSPLSNVTTAGSYFMASCTLLKAINMSPMPNLTTIDSHFMAGCTSLETIEFSPMPNLTDIAYEFMSGCTSLEAINMSPMPNLKSIGYGFMSDCTSLRTIEFSPMPNLTSIDTSFMSGCIYLRTIEFSSMPNLTGIGSRCLSHCYQLKTIEMSALTKLNCICRDFAYYCTSLEDARLPPGFSVHRGMFEGCPSSFMSRYAWLLEAHIRRYQEKKRDDIMMGRYNENDDV